MLVESLSLRRFFGGMRCSSDPQLAGAVAITHKNLNVAFGPAGQTGHIPQDTFKCEIKSAVLGEIDGALVTYSVRECPANTGSGITEAVGIGGGDALGPGTTTPHRSGETFQNYHL